MSVMAIQPDTGFVKGGLFKKFGFDGGGITKVGRMSSRSLRSSCELTGRRERCLNLVFGEGVNVGSGGYKHDDWYLVLCDGNQNIVCRD